MNVGDSTAQALPPIVLDRLTRTIVGPQGQQEELPLLSLRLLEVLAVSSPAFVGTKELLQRVWPDTHIGADALKQRVRLLRLSLTSAGYDAGLLDSARGEGYALRASLRDLPRRGAERSVRQQVRRWVAVGVGACSLLLLLLFFALRAGRSGAAESPIGPSPVRVGIVAAPGSLVGKWLVDALAGQAHLLMVPVAAASAGSAVSGCGASDRIHLCLRVTPIVGDTSRLTLTLSQHTTGAILLRAEARPAHGPEDVSSFVLQLAQFASPGVLRWIGGSTGAGDHAFTQFREGARLLGSCDVTARDDVIAGLRAAADRSPNFLPGRAMLAFHEMEAAASRADTARVARVLREAESLVATSADLALAHLAIARGAAMFGSDSIARSAAARANRLQPVLAGFTNETRMPQTGSGHAARPACGKNASATVSR